MNPVDALLKASRAVGADASLVLWGGGNSSVKTEALNFRGKRVRALYVKGSGSNMATLERSDLAVLDLEAILELKRRTAMDDEAMVAYLAQCQLEGGPRGSIETLLHAFLPPAFVLHTHADATAALVDTPHSQKYVEACWKGEVALVPYQRPGFALSLATARRYSPALKGIMLDKHGLITWGETAQEALHRTRQLVGMAHRYVAKPRRRRLAAASDRNKISWAEDMIPTLRGSLSQGERQIFQIDASPDAVRFSLLPQAAKLCSGGPATPDHLLYIKPRALYISDPSKIRASVQTYRQGYDAYFSKYASPGLRKLDSAPRVVVLKGFGMVTTGKTPRVARITRDIFRHSIWVRLAAQGLGGYRPIGPKEIFDFEYWPLENYKLTLAPPEKEMSRRIAVVTGAARGIGKACAIRLAKEGACVALMDLDKKAVEAVAAGLGDQALALHCDIGNEASVKEAFRRVLGVFGGLDVLVSNAGLARCASVETMPVKDWDESFRVNARGHFLCAREAVKIFKAQDLGGAMVFVSSKNVLAPGKDFAAYSASKAAQTQLAKVLALELAEHHVRVNCVTPDGVFDDSRLWDNIRESRAKAHGILASQLENFYVSRNLLKAKVLPTDVAEAVLYLASDRASKTTGTLLPVDGGIKEAFPR